ncbi:FUSC family protein [Ligilactobacillus ceti]|nr:FUSC family protein [Ligilactobacillus ceti]
MHVKEKDYQFLKPIGAWFTMLIPIVIGYYTNNFDIQSLGVLGAFSFHIFQIDKSVIYNLEMVALHGIALVIAFYAGINSSYNVWIIPFVILIFAFILHLVTSIYDIPRPKYFFVMVFYIIGTNFKTDSWIEALNLSKYLLVGIFSALLMAFLVCLVRGFPNYKKGQNRFKLRLAECYRCTIQDEPRTILRAIHFSEILFISAYLSILLKSEHGYWILISSAAVLSGENVMRIKERSFDRILGSVVGAILGSILLRVPMSILGKTIVLSVLFALVIYFSKKNYMIANFFATPQAYMLTSLTAKFQYHDLGRYRLVDTVVGSLIALILVAIMEYGLAVAERKKQ